jgi:hypothetical protein
MAAYGTPSTDTVAVTLASSVSVAEVTASFRRFV